MKTIEEIEEEYEGFQAVSTFIKNSDELIAFLKVGIEDIEEIEKENLKELKENKKWQLEAKIRNFFFFIFQEEEASFYDYDNEILMQALNHAKNYKSLYQRIIEIVSSENLEELVKLVDFLTYYYNQHIDYFEGERDKIELLLKGISMISPLQDNREVVLEFANKKIAELSPKKKVLVKEDQR